MEAVAYIDGASLANPGDAALAVRIYDMQGQLLKSICEPIGKQTNNFAEYYALLRCLQEAHAMGIQRLTIHTDSELIQKQWIGEYAVRSENLRPLYNEAREYEQGGMQVKIIRKALAEDSRLPIVDRMAREAAQHVQRFRPRQEDRINEI
jgi:ribonuclease HI